MYGNDAWSVSVECLVLIVVIVILVMDQYSPPYAGDLHRVTWLHELQYYAARRENAITCISELINSVFIEVMQSLILQDERAAALFMSNQPALWCLLKT